MKSENNPSLAQSIDITGAPRTNLEDSKAGIISLQTAATFNAVFDSSGEALLVVDTNGVIQRSNGRARQLLGITGREIEVGESWRVLVPHA